MRILLPVLTLKCFGDNSGFAAALNVLNQCKVVIPYCVILSSPQETCRLLHLVR